jgi:hypothetical protein
MVIEAAVHGQPLSRGWTAVVGSKLLILWPGRERGRSWYPTIICKDTCNEKELAIPPNDS